MTTTVVYLIPGVSLMDVTQNDQTGVHTVRCPGCGCSLTITPDNVMDPPPFVHESGCATHARIQQMMADALAEHTKSDGWN